MKSKASSNILDGASRSCLLLTDVQVSGHWWPHTGQWPVQIACSVKKIPCNHPWHGRQFCGCCVSRSAGTCPPSHYMWADSVRRPSVDMFISDSCNSFCWSLLCKYKKVHKHAFLCQRPDGAMSCNVLLYLEVMFIAVEWSMMYTVVDCGDNAPSKLC